MVSNFAVDVEVAQKIGVFVIAVVLAGVRVTVVSGVTCNDDEFR